MAHTRLKMLTYAYLRLLVGKKKVNKLWFQYGLATHVRPCIAICGQLLLLEESPW